jgi:hypothetical protein
VADSAWWSPCRGVALRLKTPFIQGYAAPVASVFVSPQNSFVKTLTSMVRGD